MDPSAKRRRTGESSSTSVTSKLTAQPATTNTPVGAPVVVSAEKENRAIIRPYSKCISRVSVHEFFYTTDYQERRDLFLRALSKMMNNTNTDDPWSYYAIAGIHGFPQKVYDSAEPPSGGSGYCEHGTVLFPTWHRPYVLLFEQAIIREAVNIANKLENAADKNKCLGIAYSLRVPYLDWESSFTAYQGLPDIFTQLTVHVTYPDKKTKIPNPLRSYVLPVNLGQPISASDVFNPTAKPNYHIPGTTTPFTPSAYPTVRHPDATYQSPTDTLNLSIQRSCNLMFRPQLFAVMLQTDWAKFSNHYSNPVGVKTTPNKDFYGHYASIEVVHDGFHDAAGGPGGHMTYPDIAAFDPIFWFHHCNVDRLIAMWQYANPNAYVPDPGATSSGEKNNKSALIPFWSYQSYDRGENQYLNSLDVQHIDKWNYTYHVIEKAKGWTAEQMKSYIMTKFFPDNHYGIRWYLNISNLPKRLDVGPYKVRVFIDLSDANIDTSLSSPNYVGDVSVFARSPDSDCKTCEKVPYMCGSVELTSTMKRLGILVDTEPKDAGKPISQKNPPADPFAKDSNKFTLVYVTASGEEIKLDKEPSGDSNGTLKTKPTLSLSWLAFTDARLIDRGDMKPEQMNKEFALLPRSATSEPLYQGQVIETKALS